jgi:hypothetical protein
LHGVFPARLGNVENDFASRFDTRNHGNSGQGDQCGFQVCIHGLVSLKRVGNHPANVRDAMNNCHRRQNDQHGLEILVHGLRLRLFTYET